MQGKHHTKETLKILEKKVYSKIRGKKLSEERIKSISEGHKGLYCGDKNPMWQGGKSFEPYNQDWDDKFKRAIRKRDNYICMFCGIHSEKLKKALHVHHISYDKKLTIPQNCISLCIKCHGLTNKDRETWKNLFQEKLSRLYDYKYENGNIILNYSQETLE